MCSLDDPPMSTEAILAFDTFASNACCDASFSQITSASSIVVALVGMQFARAFPRSPIESRHGWDSIKRALERYRIVSICSCDCHCQRNASRVDNDVPLAA
jgi:hypothetical protein